MSDYDKVLKKHLKVAEEQGFAIKRAQGGHIAIVNTITNRKINVPSTISSKTTMLNAVTRMKRIGYLDLVSQAKGKKKVSEHA